MFFALKGRRNIEESQERRATRKEEERARGEHIYIYIYIRRRTTNKKTGQHQESYTTRKKRRGTRDNMGPMAPRGVGPIKQKCSY